MSKSGTASPVNSSSSKSNFEIGSDWLGWCSFKESELTISYGASNVADIAAADMHAKNNCLFIRETTQIDQFWTISN